LAIFQYLDIAPESQQLWLDNWCLDLHSNNTLKEHGIENQSEIVVKRVDPNHYISPVTSQPREIGFSGTHLQSPRNAKLSDSDGLRSSQNSLSPRNSSHSAIFTPQIENSSSPMQEISQNQCAPPFIRLHIQTPPSPQARDSWPSNISVSPRIQNQSPLNLHVESLPDLGPFEVQALIRTSLPPKRILQPRRLVLTESGGEKININNSGKIAQF